MERLTNVLQAFKRFMSDDYTEQESMYGFDDTDADTVLKSLTKLSDLEEQGKLLILPCKIGDHVYVIPSKANYDLNVLRNYEENNRVYKQRVKSVAMYDNENYLLWTCDGTQCVISQSYQEDWFLTRKEAEKKLEEIKKWE